MDTARLQRNEYIAMVGGLLLAISLFIKWYEARPENANANIDGRRGTLSGWQVHDLMRWLLLAAAVAPFILAYIIATDKQLSWARGEMTAVVGIAAFGLILYSGVIDRPGEPSGEIELEIGWYGALLGSILMIVGAAMRSSDVERARKPPGTI